MTVKDPSSFTTGEPLILAGGNVLTMNPAHPVADAIGIIGDQIQIVGTLEQVVNFMPGGSKKVQLEGRTVLPGLHDSHMHAWKVGQLLTKIVDLRDCNSWKELRKRVQAHKVRSSDEWTTGRGVNERFLPDLPARSGKGARLPDRDDLDTVLNDRPIALTRTCGHIAVANSRALDRAGIDRTTPDPEGGQIERDESGRPTGILRETAIGLLTRAQPTPSESDFEDMILAATHHMASLGVTTITEAGVTPDILRAYETLDAEGRLPIRCNLMLYRQPDGGEVSDLPAIIDRPRLRLKTVKLLADGGLSGGTAAVDPPYLDGRQGLMRLDADQIVTLAREPRNLGWQVAVHAIGERAIQATLDAFERLGPAPEGLPDRIEHFGLPNHAHLTRARDLHVAVIPQTMFLRELSTNFRQWLPENRVAESYPVKSMLAAGLIVALSSDAPVVLDADPLRGVETSITRRDESGSTLCAAEKITVEEALSCYTRLGAMAAGMSHQIGSIEPGRFADLVILDRNPLEIPVEEIPEIKGREVWVGGRAVAG